MNILTKIIVVVFSFCVISVNSFAQGTYSGQAVNESLASGSHASNSVACSVIAGSQVVSAVAAVPLIVVGASGAVSGEVGEELWDAATAEVPLEISDEIITAGPPPDEAMNL